ncbi:hypothetical protein QL285_083939 [Trifolium repens]|nr:hypothetical protein QL285_083939 [Trifolium repens]
MNLQDPDSSEMNTARKPPIAQKYQQILKILAYNCENFRIPVLASINGSSVSSKIKRLYANIQTTMWCSKTKSNPEDKVQIIARIRTSRVSSHYAHIRA